MAQELTMCQNNIFYGFQFFWYRGDPNLLEETSKYVDTVLGGKYDGQVKRTSYILMQKYD